MTTLSPPPNIEHASHELFLFLCLRGFFTKESSQNVLFTHLPLNYPRTTPEIPLSSIQVATVLTTDVCTVHILQSSILIG